MIHSGPLVQTENFDSPQRPRFPLPAEYYSTPPGDRRPLFPAWVALGCGSVSIAILLGLFGTGYFLTHGGLGSLMTWFFNQTRKELAGIYAKDVTATQKKDFDTEMATLQQNLKAKRLGTDKIQPILTDVRDVMMDSKATPAEMDRLIAALRKANGLAVNKAPSR